MGLFDHQVCLVFFECNIFTAFSFQDFFDVSFFVWDSFSVMAAFFASVQLALCLQSSSCGFILPSSKSSFFAKMIAVTTLISIELENVITMHHKWLYLRHSPHEQVIPQLERVSSRNVSMSTMDFCLTIASQEWAPWGCEGHRLAAWECHDHRWTALESHYGKNFAISKPCVNGFCSTFSILPVKSSLVILMLLECCHQWHRWCINSTTNIGSNDEFLKLH